MRSGCELSASVRGLSFNVSDPSLSLGVGLCRVISGSYRDNGKENGNYYFEFRDLVAWGGLMSHSLNSSKGVIWGTI